MPCRWTWPPWTCPSSASSRWCPPSHACSAAAAAAAVCSPCRRHRAVPTQPQLQAPPLLQRRRAPWRLPGGARLRCWCSSSLSLRRGGSRCRRAAWCGTPACTPRCAPACAPASRRWALSAAASPSRLSRATRAATPSSWRTLSGGPWRCTALMMRGARLMPLTPPTDLHVWVGAWPQGRVQGSGPCAPPGAHRQRPR